MFTFVQLQTHVNFAFQSILHLIEKSPVFIDYIFLNAYNSFKSFNSTVVKEARLKII